MSKPNRHVDLLVVGGGVLGAFHAWHAIGANRSVLLLERNSAPRGATVRNFGQIVPSGMNRAWQAWGRDSLAIYKSIQAQFDISLRQQGSIYLASDEEELGLLEELREINRADDYPSQLLTRQQCSERYPALRPDYCRGGLFFPQEVSVNPRLMIHRLHQFLAEQAGFEARFDCCVCKLQEDDRGRVRAETGDGQSFVAERAIVCNGCEFRILFPRLFRESGLEAVRLQMLRLSPRPTVKLPGNILTGLTIRRYESFAECPSWASVKAREPADSLWKQWGVHVLFKQEADGGIILGDSHQYLPAARIDQMEFDLNTEINDCLVREGQKILELPDWNIETSWSGMYCQTADPSGILTRTVGERIHIVTGIGGKGMTGSAGFAKHHLEEILDDGGNP